MNEKLEKILTSKWMTVFLSVAGFVYVISFAIDMFKGDEIGMLQSSVSMLILFIFMNSISRIREKREDQ